ncbi:hypothetical protein PG994_004872 [Apiospora phragmitis]|uniref:Uncharacterized protein n=1 Tax=Apiospora phragmitis TaxID=2905665 RepID=A0ABR1VRX7_9PEZI
MVNMRAQVLRYPHLGTEHAHSLLAMLYHIANRLVADPNPELIALLAQWSQRVATRYITNQTEQNKLRSAIGAMNPPIVAEGAGGSIKAYRTPADWPGIIDAIAKREAAMAGGFGRSAC